MTSRRFSRRTLMAGTAAAAAAAVTRLPASAIEFPAHPVYSRDYPLLTKC